MLEDSFAVCFLGAWPAKGEQRAARWHNSLPKPYIQGCLPKAPQRGLRTSFCNDLGASIAQQHSSQQQRQEHESSHLRLIKRLVTGHLVARFAVNNSLSTLPPCPVAGWALHRRALHSRPLRCTTHWRNTIGGDRLELGAIPLTKPRSNLAFQGPSLDVRIRARWLPPLAWSSLEL